MAPAFEKKLTGLVAATFTPFTTDGHINLKEIGPYVDYLKNKQGVTNIFVNSESADLAGKKSVDGMESAVVSVAPVVNGTTGESVSLSVEERKQLAAEWCQKARDNGMEQVLVHVGCMSLKDTQELARHAEEIRADGIAVMSPSFFKPNTADALRELLREVASAAQTLPLYYYHIPVMTGVKVNARDVLEGIEELIPSFKGVKFTDTDLMDFGLCVSRSPPNWSILYGVDEQLLAALAMGAEGAVGSTYNYLGCQAKELMSAFKAGDLSKARKIEFNIQELLCFAIKHGFDLGVNKQLMCEVSGLHLGPPRLPLLPCPASVAQRIAAKYHSLLRDL